MSCVRRAVVCVVALSLACVAAAEKPKPKPASNPLPSAESIMTQVAANQDRAEGERAHYVYVQHAKMVSRRGDTVKCEEITDYRVTPSDKGSQQQLLKLQGRLLKDHKYVTYTALKPKDDKPKDDKPKDDRPRDDKPAAEKDHDAIEIDIGDETLDRDMVENIRDNLTHDESKDGLTARLFPLTTKDQADYSFRMIGRERMNGHDTFHIAFGPKKKDDFGWKGEAYIDTQAFQPVLVTTVMARKIPFAVRTFLGTNLPGLGFTVTYAPQGDGVWFPSSFSTEFKIHVLFFFRREIILDAQNKEFEKTHVTSRIVGEASEVENKEP